jgi:uncharacterized integral membrane protein
MLFLIVLTVVAVAVAVGALQNGHAVIVSFLFWQFQAPLALVILGATVAGLVIGGVIGFARFVRRWSYRQAGPTIGSGDSSPADPRSAPDRRLAAARSDAKRG